MGLWEGSSVESALWERVLLRRDIVVPSNVYERGRICLLPEIEDFFAS